MVIDLGGDYRRFLEKCASYVTDGLYTAGLQDFINEGLFAIAIVVGEEEKRRAVEEANHFARSLFSLRQACRFRTPIRRNRTALDSLRNPDGRVLGYRSARLSRSQYDCPSQIGPDLRRHLVPTLPTAAVENAILLVVQNGARRAAVRTTAL
jgi:hypothetical protein